MIAPIAATAERLNHRVFRTASGLVCTAKTLPGGARLYSPVSAAWMRVRYDRLADTG